MARAFDQVTQFDLVCKTMCPFERFGRYNNARDAVRPFDLALRKPGRMEGREDVENQSVQAKEMERDGRMLRLDLSFTITYESKAGRAALLLAATTSPVEETRLREQLQQWGWRAVATEVGGLAGDLPQKITRAVVGAALNANVVEKRSGEMHALMHAALEAMNGFMSTSMLEASIGAKIAIVRNGAWLAVAVMGDSAYHAVAHHERCGLGIMHV